MWADNRGFDEVLISKRMIKDHMPDTVLESLAKVTEIQEGNDPVDLRRKGQLSNYSKMRTTAVKV